MIASCCQRHRKTTTLMGLRERNGVTISKVGLVCTIFTTFSDLSF